MEKSDRDVLDTTLRCIKAARRHVPLYATDLSPVRTDQTAELLKRLNVRLEVFPFESSTVAVTLPGGGVTMMFIDQGAARTDRQLAIRHELGHVLTGHVDGAVFLNDHEYTSPAERAADLFALADLVPRWWLAWMRREGRMSWSAVLEDVRAAIRSNYAELWPQDRIDDRARLRMLLFRSEGV